MSRLANIIKIRCGFFVRMKHSTEMNCSKISFFFIEVNFTGTIMKRPLGILLLLVLLAVVGCASSKRPVLYPNAHLTRVGQPQADADINACMRAAEASGANSGKGEELAKSTAKAGAVGGATGAVVGAIASGPSMGRSAAIGGAGAATATLVGGAFDASEPTQVYMRFVEQCLRDKGYQPIGWR